MSEKLRAYMILKSNNIIDRATDAKYLGYHGGNHVFGIRPHSLCIVDVICETCKIKTFGDT